MGQSENRFRPFWKPSPVAHGSPFSAPWNWSGHPNPKGHSERPTNLCLSGALREARHGRH